MNQLELEIWLLRDTTFGRGDAQAGVVDQEIEHDPETGLPYIKGRTLKGLLVEECANILFTVQAANQSLYTPLTKMALRLFGRPGSQIEDQAVLHVGSAHLPSDFRANIHDAIARKQFRSHDVLAALTTIRHQTAVDYSTGAPMDGSLRAVRAILRNTRFYAPLFMRQNLTDDELGLLAACVSGLHRAGTSRNRGRGRLQARLIGIDHDSYIRHFTAILRQKG